jgi:hypothetical protein
MKTGFVENKEINSNSRDQRRWYQVLTFHKDVPHLHRLSELANNISILKISSDLLLNYYLNAENLIYVT